MSQHYSSRLCYLLGPCESKSLQQRRQCENYTIRTFWDSSKLPWSKMVLTRIVQWICRWTPDCSKGTGFVLCLRGCGVPYRWFTFHGQPLCSGSFLCFCSHGSFPNRTNASVEVVVAMSQHYSSRLCYLLGPCESKSLQQRRRELQH